MRRLALALVLALVGTGVVACSDDGSDSELTVLAAASLNETFTTLADAFETAHPDVSVRLSFDSSATLAGQAVGGAPADVLATADASTMQDAVDAGAVISPAPFASNTMTLVVPAGNPAGITSFVDLDAPGVDYVVCVDTAPCGRAGAGLLDRNGIAAEPASLETDVKAVLAKVVSDEADAGLVYVTDAVAAGDAVQALDIPEADTEALQYPIGVLEQAGDRDLAQEFVDLVLSAEGQAILRDAGFGAP